MPKLGLLGGVVEPRKRDAEPMHPVARRECPRVGDPAHRDHVDALGGEVPTAALRQGVQRHPVADPLDQHDGAQRGHVTIGARGTPAGQQCLRQRATPPRDPVQVVDHDVRPVQGSTTQPSMPVDPVRRLPDALRQRHEWMDMCSLSALRLQVW